VTFPPSPPTPRKGFVYATARLPDKEITVVSLHLDFLSATARIAQIEELARHLAPRRGPLVVMGDFNTDWEEGGAVRRLAERLNLRAYQPQAEDLASFPLTGKRLDWILISPELRFVDYRVLPEVVSDHRVVVAEVDLVDAH
jgi:endonuclease/exonuclease/phosphatase family metal-dependent hydrolase